MMFIVSCLGRILTHDGESPHEIEAWLDRTMDELCDLGAVDPKIDLDLGRMTVGLAVAVEASNPLAAIAQASGLLRCSIHAAGGGTPDWPTVEDDQVWGIQLVDVSASEQAQTEDVTQPDDPRVPEHA